MLFTTLRIAVSATAVLALSGLVGCSPGEEIRSYKAPDDLCNIEVEPTLLEPFLPPGRSLDVESGTRWAETGNCTLSADGHRFLTVGWEWGVQADSLYDVAARQDGLGPYEPEHKQRYLHAGNGAIGQVNCHVTTSPESPALTTVIRLDDLVKPDAPAMLRLITAYTEAVRESGLCEKWRPSAAVP
ncbi:hypothetical protein [Streptomyces sp. NPDC060194]|uniref:hypothetical protein n=1 Tax=Streptomyces sp. NPDC060194 TaxID=3347069 RepID=UPI00364F34DE